MRPFFPVAEVHRQRTRLQVGAGGEVGAALAEARLRLSRFGERSKKPTHPAPCGSKAVGFDRPADALPLSSRSIMLSTPSKAGTPTS